MQSSERHMNGATAFISDFTPLLELPLHALGGLEESCGAFFTSRAKDVDTLI